MRPAHRSMTTSHWQWVVGYSSRWVIDSGCEVNPGIRIRAEMFYDSQSYLSENKNMGSTSWKVLLMEMMEDRGYAKGYTDGKATGRVTGRQQGMAIARRQIAKELLHRNSLPAAMVAEATNLLLAAVESLQEVS